MPIASFPAFKSISVDGNLITADETGDTLTLVAGSNIALSYNAGNDSIEIAASGTISASLPITQDNTTNATNYLVFSSSASGDLTPRVDTGLYYNPYTNILTAGAFNGPATKWSTARTVTFTGDVTGSFSIDGSADVSNVDITVVSAGGYTLPAATTSTLGGVKIDGTTIQINGSGVISGFNGDYTSLSNKPTIPTAVSQLTNDSGFITLSSVPTAVSQLTNDSGFSTQEYSFKIAGDDSVQRTIGNNETVKFVGANGIAVTTDTEGNVTITGSGGASTGDVTFTGTTIDSTDSSGIVFQPLVTFNSNVVVENDIQLTGTLNSSGVIVSGAIIPTVDNVYDLGTPSLRFRHLYVGPGTIYIGDNTRAITATETSIDLPSGTTIGGEEPLKTTIQNIFQEIINNYLLYGDITGAPTDIAQLADSQGKLSQGLVQITNLTYPTGQSYVLITGDEEVTITGVGFQSLCNVYINGAPVASTSYVNSTTVTFVTAEVNAAGTYSLNIINPDGTSAAWGPGIIFVSSSSPKFTDPSGLLETFTRGVSATTTLDVAGGTEPYTFSITGGALPSGLTLDTDTGEISGTTPSVSADTVYNFIATVTDDAAASTSAAFQIAITIPVPWTFNLTSFGIKSNKVFFTEYEEDFTNTPTFTLDSFSIKSNATFFTEYEEDITNSPVTIELGSFSVSSYTP